jgi:chromodomain-helicase-DNA-binding protein 1
VVDNRTTTDTGAAAELLSSFNVATFKNDQDDATFWSRLITVEERDKVEKENKEDLLPRAARLRPEERAALGLADSSDSDAEGGEGGEGGSGKKPAGKKARARPRGAVKKNVSGAEPGPPVDGAALRVDEWLLDVDVNGRPVVKTEEAPITPTEDGAAEAGSTNVRTISRRDANAFVRGVRRWGLVGRLDKIAAEVGPTLEEAAPAARLSLWHSLMDGCRKAVELTVQEEQDSKVRRESNQLAYLVPQLAVGVGMGNCSAWH